MPVDVFHAELALVDFVIIVLVMTLFIRLQRKPSEINQNFDAFKGFCRSNKLHRQYVYLNEHFLKYCLSHSP